MKAIRPKTMNSFWRKLCPDVANDLTGFMTEPIKEIMKKIVDVAKKKKKGGDESFQGMDLEKIQELIDITSEELTDLMVMSSSKPVLDDE